ncbi:MAG: AMP-binding protein [Gammaproteobacteria bacterium]|nr:AMP-binding protein [Gammaproteobacteria bacterium]
MNESPSHVHGATDTPLIEATIGAMLERAVQRWPEREALVSVAQGIRWNYAEFGRRVEELALGLAALGLRRGDRVAVWAPNCAEWVLTQFATARAGLIQVNINPAYRLSELEFTLTKVGVKSLIAATAFKSSDNVGMIEALAPEITSSRPGGLKSARLPALQVVAKIGGGPRAGWFDFEDLSTPAIRGDAPVALPRDLSNRDPINIQFTSGTTGLPKGATLSHRNLVNNAYFVGRSTGLREGDRLCVPVPLYHCFGMVMSNLACVIHGATIVYPSAGFDPLEVLKAVQAERCTVLHGVPTMFIAELEHPRFGEFDLTSLRSGIMAGSPCPIEVMRQVVERMHMREVTIAYGMTETSPVSFQSSPDDPLERRVTTVGRIQPHMEAKVIDATGSTVARGAVGELCTRGYAVMLGYWEDAERTSEAIDGEGWMHTGDLATLDADGYCNIAGRAKDMIIRGGENVYPREIEEFLYRHPKIADVAVIGVPDPKYGEEVCAWVRLHAHASSTEEEVREFCRGQIAHYKVPRYVLFVESFPATVTGKVQKYLMRQQMIERLGLEEQRTA